MYALPLSFVTALLALCLPPIAAQLPPPRQGVKTVNSRFHRGVSISYKDPGICETTPGVRSYSGFVHLPPGTLVERGEAQDYPVNTFFWFFEARRNPRNAPLSIWLNGGPGGSSLLGALTENGPCFVGNDSNSTYLNPWSWNNEVNMLYIDQPNQVGFSHSSLRNITLNLLGSGKGGSITFPPQWQFADFSNGIPKQNTTFLVGTWPSMNVSRTANSTNHSAIALWHFAQTWLAEFPEYVPKDNRVSIWAESYGGHYAPAIGKFFVHQNEKIARGELRGAGLMPLRIDTIGIINGAVDALIDARAHADFGHHNTYGIQVFNDSEYKSLIHALERKGGLLDGIRKCQRLARELDPRNIGNVDRVNKACATSAENMDTVLVDSYQRSGKYGWFDVTHPLRDPMMTLYMNGYLNQRWVQKALGVPLNYTVASEVVSHAFDGEGDYPRGGGLDSLAYLLDHGTKVALMYGDRDYACNWIGGERVSQAIPHRHRDAFQRAGYAPIALNSLHSGGQTRQFGNLSFSRVYQSGHTVPQYQPETAYRIFTRAMFNRDIATGKLALRDDLRTHGPNSTWHHLNDVLPPPEPVCYILSSILPTCSPEQLQWLQDGTAIIRDWIIVGREPGSGKAKGSPDLGLSPNQRPLGTGL